MTDKDNEVTLREAAKLAGIKSPVLDAEVPEYERPSNQPGAEATMTLEAMLGASRKGKTVR